MANKLTLSISSDVAESAKEYAKKHGRSLSNMVEEYLKFLVSGDADLPSQELDARVKALWKSVNAPPEDLDHKDLLSTELTRKYLDE